MENNLFIKKERTVTELGVIMYMIATLSEGPHSRRFRLHCLLVCLEYFTVLGGNDPTSASEVCSPLGWAPI